MIDPTKDRLVPVLEGLEQVRSFRPSPACAWRMHAKGVRVAVPLPDGRTEMRRVKLATVKFAGRRCTTLSAIRDFILAMNPDPTPRPDADHDATDARLREAGLL